MGSLEGIALQVSLTCPHCHQPLHVQGLAEAELCAACQNPVALSPEAWLGWFGPEEIAEALTLPDGEGRQISSFGGTTAKYSYGHRMPRCQKCQTDVPTGELEGLAAAGGWSCPCGERVRVRPATDLAKVMVPGARWLANEGATSEGGEVAQAAEPVLFQCLACAGALEIDGSERTIKCTYCGGSNFIPDGLWLRMHPPQTVRTFFVVAEPGEAAEGVPLALLERLASSEDSDVRASVAANTGIPPALMARFVEDDDHDVRRALAANAAVPAALLERLARDSDDDVREAVALNPDTPLSVVVALLSDSDWEVRRGAVRSGRCPDDALAKLAVTESDSDVTEALGALDLGLTTLRALGTSDQWRSRQAAAQHRSTPDDVLVALASDGDSDVLEALVARDVLPAGAVLALASQDRSSVAERARARPEYGALASARRRKRVMVGGALVSLLLCAGAGTGGLGFLGMAARWAWKHLL